MEKISRYFLVLIAIIVFAIILPKLYWISFAEPIRVPLVQYSCVDNDFLILRTDNGIKRTNSRGFEFTREEYEAKLPFVYTRQLLINESMPDTIDGVEMDLNNITTTRSIFRIKPSDIDSPKPSLLPLFESQSGRANLEIPEDFFRITWRMEFLNAATNKINEEKSRMFSAVLYKRGFKFPAKSIYGLPSTRKSCDEGYLVVDSADQLFHLKMIKAKPFVKKVDVPVGLKFKYIKCVDFKHKFYYAYLFSEDKHIYILTQYDYLLTKFPLENIDPVENEIRIYGDLFNYNVISIGEGNLVSYILDKDYQKIDEYSESWLVQNQKKEGEIAQLLFPFQLKMTNSKSGFIKFFFERNQSFYWLILSLVLSFIHFLILSKRKVKITNHIFDMLIIVCFGIFGLAAVNFFPNKFYD